MFLKVVFKGLSSHRRRNRWVDRYSARSLIVVTDGVRRRGLGCVLKDTVQRGHANERAEDVVVGDATDAK